MKKVLLFPVALLISIALGYMYCITFEEAVKPAAEGSTGGFTTEQLLQEEIRMKKERRARGYAKADKPGEYMKFHEAIRTRYGMSHPEYSADYKLQELRKARHHQKGKGYTARTQAKLNWVERGPGNVPGRTRGLLVMPDDPEKNTWLAGSVAGGVWKTTDAGESWTNKTPELPNMATSTLAMSAANPQIIYAGTGESFAGYNGTSGDGIFKSVDGGENWSQLSSTAGNDDFRNINRIAVDPQNADRLLVATQLGYWGGEGIVSKLLLSENGGESWIRVYESEQEIEDLRSTHDDFSTLYASINRTGIIKSTDGGHTWSATGAIEATGRIEIALAPLNPEVMYALAESSISGSGSDLFISETGGADWKLVANENTAETFDYLGGQGWYDNTIVVSPYDPYVVYLGGVNLFKVKVVRDIERTDILGVHQVDTKDFLSFVNFGQSYFNGRLSKGELEESSFVTVEMRFGAGLKQKAHRFTVPEGATSGVDASLFAYQDYVEVPFQVWDVDNNRQLMVAFRDQEGDGEFNLNDQQKSDSELSDNREYVYISALPYSETPATEMTKDGSHEYQNMYFFWPTLTPGATWQPEDLPDSRLVIEYGSKLVKESKIQVVADAYGNFDGPNRFTQQTNETRISGLHPDHHNLLAIPVDESAKTFKILNANDGGVYYSNTSTEPGIKDGDWTFAGHGYNTTQFYGVDKKPGADEYIGGTQDNGTWRSPANAQAGPTTRYHRQLGGDGFEVVWHYDKPEQMLGSIYYNAIYKTTDGGNTWAKTNTGLGDNSAGKAPFITKIGNSKARPDVVYTLGASGVWKSSDFGDSWDLTSISGNWLTGSFMDVEVSLANPDIVWAGSGMIEGKASLYVSTDEGESFSPATNYNTHSMGVITGVYTHPVEENTAYALFSFAKMPKILKTTDLGKSWQDISGFENNRESSRGFPDVAAYCLLVHPYNNDIIWVGTEIGLVESLDGGNSWHLANNGFPNVSVWDMKVVDDQIVIGTHARGIWTVDLSEFEGIPAKPLVLNAGRNPAGKLALQINFQSQFDSTKVMVNDKVLLSLGENPLGDAVFKVDYSEGGYMKAKVYSYKNGIRFISNTKSVSLYVVPDVVTHYSNAFNVAYIARQDFMEDGLIIAEKEGFSNSAIHSSHNYKVNSNSSILLKNPVIVAPENATINYKDVAIVEPGDEGSAVGDQEFRDYVAVEGSLDGINWEVLKGYDAALNAAWKEGYTLGKDGDESMFVEHEIDLLQTFNPQDTILLRFSLFSDEQNVGYGWVIDDLKIQLNSPLGFEDDVLENRLSLLISPNPVKDVADIRYFIPKPADVSIRIIDMTGATVLEKKLGKQDAGQHSFHYDLRSYRGNMLMVILHTTEGKRTAKMIVGR